MRNDQYRLSMCLKKKTRGGGGQVVEGGDFLVPNKKVEHCLHGCKYLYSLIHCGVLQSVQFYLCEVVVLAYAEY